MKIVLAADIAGFDIKETIKKHLSDKGHEIIDVGMASKEKFIWWYEVCADAVDVIRSGKADIGILICGSGAGMSAYANKHEGIFAVACESVYAAKQCRNLLDANVMTMGGHIVGPGMSCAMADAFVETEFAEGAAPERKKYLSEQKNKFAELDAACFSSK